jgi:hypothetical protein
MKGMIAHSLAFGYTGDEAYSSHQYEFAPASLIAEISMTQYYELDDECSVELGFKRCSYLDDHGVTRDESFPGPGSNSPVTVFQKNRLASATVGMRVSTCICYFIINFFIWDHV